MAIEAIAKVSESGYSSNGSAVKAVQSAHSAQHTAKQSVSEVRNIKDTREQANTEEGINQANEKIKKAVTDLNKNMANTSCQFGMHEGTGRVTIKIVDKETKEVVKEFPAEETLEMIEKVWELAGIMVDEKL